MKSAIALFAIMSLSAPAQESTTLEWKPQVGEPVNLQMSVNLAMQGMDIQVSFVIKNKVTKIDKEADRVTSESEMTDFTLMVGGQEMDMGGQGPAGGEKVVMVQKLNGEIVSDGTPVEMGGGERMTRMNAFHRPGKTVKVGESWEHEFKADKEKGLGSAKARWTLAARENKNGVDCWKVDYVFAEMDDPNGMSSSGSIWFDYATGNVHYSTYQFNNVSFQEGMPPSSGTGEIKRLKG